MNREAELRDRIEELEEEVRQLRAVLSASETPLPPHWNLSKTEAMIARQLIALPFVPRERILHTLYGQRPDGPPEYANRIIHIHIAKMRRKNPDLKAGLVTDWDEGYHLRSDVRDRLKAGLSKQTLAQNAAIC